MLKFGVCAIMSPAKSSVRSCGMSGSCGDGRFFPVAQDTVIKRIADVIKDIIRIFFILWWIVANKIA